MRVAFLDCFAGISGDMFLGALTDAGVPLKVLEDAAAALGLGATLQVETVDRSGIAATKVHVLEHGQLAEGVGHAPHGHSHEHSHPNHEGGHEGDHGAETAGSAAHAHGRSLSSIRSLIEAAALPEAVKQRAIRTFELLGSSEAKIHNVSVERIHFHEVGAVDALVDIVAGCAGIEYLDQLDQSGPVAWFASPVNVGGGMVECAHGTFPVPAPATADLLRGIPTYSGPIEKELATPTGAALLRTLDATFGPQPAMRVQSIGYGAGTRNPRGFPNVLRLSLGEPSAAPANPRTGEQGTHGHAGETVTVLETALDDCTPQILAHVAERALATGALDVMLTPVIMKKGRPGTLVTVLCNGPQASALQDLLLRETSTLGVRMHRQHRSCLDRSHTTVATAYGAIRMKTGTRRAGEQPGEELNVAPEFEDCRAAAAAHEVAVKLVMQAALAAYLLEPAPQKSGAGQTLVRQR